jgi:lactate permease
MKSLGLMQVIAGSISRITVSRLGQAILCGWTFAGFIEGIAGFGVPAAICAPLMITLGFTPLIAVVAVLVGHSWAVTFGGMAGAYYTIELATGLPENKSRRLWLHSLHYP